VSSPANAPTIAAPVVSGSATSGSLGGRFTAGQTLGGGRYRILGLLGEGGMGEVYKAEDLKLRQFVALKFLPDSVAFEPQALARFHNEVRVARQVAHPSVCRVYDIGEENGLHFLSMEFIDGEDLASLLRRIGRLPGDKAAELGRQICAGLAAAHDQGVLHRDLKPANIMIDGRGNARITDFGLAVLNEEVRGDAARSGTPAYMAPEQLAGREATTRSDIYSLGLVLYEMFTGRPVFEAQSWQEFHKLHESSVPPTPSSVVKDIDPLAERVILRCLEKDPKNRPPTANRVGIALPGGDPLQAALAAGETPSPEMVAAAAKSGSLRPLAAACCLTVTIGLLLWFMSSGPSHLVHTRVPLRKSPEVLAERASELSQTFGYRDALDRAYGFSVDQRYFDYARGRNEEAEYWHRIQSGQPLTFYFWYRQSPGYLLGKSFFVGDISLPDPPQDRPGMVSMILDPRGRLVEFNAVPSREVADQPISPGGWEPFFAAAGVSMSAFAAAKSQWNPPTFADSKQAWSGSHPDHADIPIRIEAASNQGRPIYFHVVAPWDRIERLTRYRPDPSNGGAAVIALVLAAITILGAVVLARYNLRRGRGDRRGALLVAGFIVLVQSGVLVRAHHVPTLGELTIIRDIGFVAVLTAAAAWVYYLALEPLVRRFCPSLLVGWTRLLAGDFRDPMVGRDILVGGMMGLIGHPFMIHIGHRAEMAIGKVTPVAFPPPSDWRYLFSNVVEAFESGLLTSLFCLLLFLIAFILVRRGWLAALILASAMYLYLVTAFATSWPFYVVLAIQSAAAILTVWRFGLLASLIYYAYFRLAYMYPLTPDVSLWYSGGGYFLLAFMAALSTFGFHTACGGQKIFNGRLLAE